MGEETKKEQGKDKMTGSEKDKSDETITESVTNYISETANAVGDYISGAAGETKHKAKSEVQEQKRDANWEKAKNSDRPIGERAEGVKDAAGAEMDHLTESAKKKKEETKKEQGKDKMTGSEKDKSDETI